MKINKIHIACLGILIVVIILTFTKQHQTWNTFADAANGWEISYPKEITTIELADDIGPKKWLDNIVFKNKDVWVFSVWVGNVKDAPLLSKEKNVFSFIRGDKLFIIRTNDNAPTEDILSSLKVED